MYFLRLMCLKPKIFPLVLICTFLIFGALSAQLIDQSKISVSGPLEVSYIVERESGAFICFLGEAINNTREMIGKVVLFFTVYDENKNLLAQGKGKTFEAIAPGEKVPFCVWFSHQNGEKWESLELLFEEASNSENILRSYGIPYDGVKIKNFKAEITKETSPWQETLFYFSASGMIRNEGAYKATPIFIVVNGYDQEGYLVFWATIYDTPTELKPGKSSLFEGGSIQCGAELDKVIKYEARVRSYRYPPINYLENRFGRSNLSWESEMMNYEGKGPISIKSGIGAKGFLLLMDEDKTLREYVEENGIPDYFLAETATEKLSGIVEISFQRICIIYLSGNKLIEFRKKSLDIYFKFYQAGDIPKNIYNEIEKNKKSTY